jgi:hypothetical protein
VGWFGNLFKKALEFQHCGALLEFEWHKPKGVPEIRFTRCPDCSRLNLSTKGLSEYKRAQVLVSANRIEKRMFGWEKTLGRLVTEQEMGAIIKDDLAGWED